jgi:hypothetical protein
MASAIQIQITCIRLSGTLLTEARHEHITHAGNATGVWPRADIIAWIKSGSYVFFTLVGGLRADIRVREDRIRGEYIQTYADGVWKDNLLALPRCP